METDHLIAIIGLIILVIGVVFLILREFFCWYFKINERIEILKDIQSKLNKNKTDSIE